MLEEQALVVHWDEFVRDGSYCHDKSPRMTMLKQLVCSFPMVATSDRAAPRCGRSDRSRHAPFSLTRNRGMSCHPENISTCLRKKHNIRFAGLEILRQFSYERAIRSGCEFGFHGTYNCSAEIWSDMMAKLIGSLEPGVARCRERADVISNAVVRGEIKFARLCMKRPLPHSQAVRLLVQSTGRLFAQSIERAGSGKPRGEANGS